ncbi:Asp-tRNA(Asn)/Glu-tRNA(Gln) amidotransferase subunit GatC [candidate division KSB1 bacterium]|nr:Asp-tRNA(Asn)/Glu-tRNA(Gln) amidotransferase subunit GatC [candidate division KSB1 bacterium]
MAVTLQIVQEIAHLAKLEFSNVEKEHFIVSFNQILDYVEQLKELELDTVEPTAHVVAVQNVWRQDCVEPSLSRDKVLCNAPAQSKGLYSVPKVIG